MKLIWEIFLTFFWVLYGVYGLVGKNNFGKKLSYLFIFMGIFNGILLFV